MKMSVNNIKFVKELTKNGVTYEWFVAMKSNMMSDSRQFVNYVNGKTTADVEYPISKLPKTVQKYLENACGTVIECHEYNGDEYTHIIY